MRVAVRELLFGLLCGVFLSSVCADVVTFDDDTALAGWEITGDARIDREYAHDGGGSALCLGPGSKVVIKLNENDGSGKLDLWVYEDMAMPKDPKERRLGPRWGLLQSDGQMITLGAIYAPYLSGDKTYATSYYNLETHFSVGYLGECRRTMGWHRWTFDMDPDKGLVISMDGKDVNATRKRFNWGNTKFGGAVSVVLLGDETKDKTQAVWVDDLEVQGGGPMNVKPAPPPPPPPVVPEQDPAPEGEPAALLDGVKDVHPRLLFGPEDVPALREFAESEQGKLFKEALLGYLPVSRKPDHTNFLKDATDGQRQGLWRLPTVALHYVLTGDRTSFDRTVEFMKFLLEQPDWETSGERNSGMSAANIMIGAALAYDWLYNDLDPEFREKYRQKLMWHARAMYHGGHLNKNKQNGYWQGDPANNHRWHRNAGMTLCLLTAAGGAPEEQWILNKTKEDLDYVTKWLPEDGTSHEGPGYLVFGGAHLTLALQAADRCLGTEYLQHPFYAHVGYFHTQMMAPGLGKRFFFGDSGGGGLGKLGYDLFVYKAAGVHRQADVQAVMNRVRDARGVEWGWMGLVWYDPTLAPAGSANDYPLAKVFGDVGVACIREGWELGQVGAMFKSGPFGGYRLNQYRDENGGKYINVAHDDPDANSFILMVNDQLVAETDRYSKHKQSSNFNTILINGMGQMVPGRPEGGVWSQPGGDTMTDMAYLTGFKDVGEIVIVEGEAGGSYRKYSDRKTGRSRPDIDCFRRTFVWVKGKYILALDRVRAPQDVDVTWLMQGPTLSVVDEEAGMYRLAAEGASCDFVLQADELVETVIMPSSSDNRGEKLGWQQLQASAKVGAIRFASMYLPWGGDAKLVIDSWRPDEAQLKVSGDGWEHTWQWRAAPDVRTPSTVVLQRADVEDLTFDQKDQVEM